jgi:hypothetical protein
MGISATFSPLPKWAKNRSGQHPGQHFAKLGQGLLSASSASVPDWHGERPSRPQGPVGCRPCRRRRVLNCSRSDMRPKCLGRRLAFVKSKNVQRRDLMPSKAAIGLKFAGEEIALARARQNDNRRAKSRRQPASNSEAGRSREAVATAVGVSLHLMQRI